MNKKILLLILLGIVILAGCPSLDVSAQLTYLPSPYSFSSLLDKIETATWIVFTVIVLVCFVTSGVMFLTAQGDPEKIKTARSSFVWGVAGVIVGIIAFAIITLTKNVLT